MLEIIEFFWAVALGFFPNRSQTLSRTHNVLVLPGWGAGSRFYSKLQKKLQSAGYKVSILELPPWKSEKELLPHLIQALQASPDQIIVLAHNTSGLLMGALPDPARRKVDCLVTLGTPFRGFRFARFWGQSEWEPNAPALELRQPAYLFINHFHPLFPIEEYLFSPTDIQTYGQGRDQWFDIGGNYNLVRRSENIRTLLEFLQSIRPLVPVPDSTTVTIPAGTQIRLPEERLDRKRSATLTKSAVVKKPIPKKTTAKKKTSTPQKPKPKKK